MRTAHLFAGAGGGLYSDLILGHTPILAIEIERYCCDVLKQRKTEGWFPRLHVHCGDVREFYFGPWAGKVDCISAGFPCTDISCAGKGAGITGTQSGLVSEVWRAIDVIRPGLVFLENSPNIRTKGRREIITELVARGYSWRDGTLAASDVGAPHKRNRWWLLAANADGMWQLEQEMREKKQRGWVGNQVEAFADTDGQHANMGGLDPGALSQLEASGIPGCQKDDVTDSACDGCGSRRTECAGQQGAIQLDRGVKSPVADSMCGRLEGAIQRRGIPETVCPEIEAVKRYTCAYDWNPADCETGGMADGMACKKHRIKALGNGQVPLQAALAFVILSGMEG